MKLENMKEEFPKMPEKMRVLVEQEVARQIGEPETKKRYSGKEEGGEQYPGGAESRDRYLAERENRGRCVGETQRTDRYPGRRGRSGARRIVTIGLAAAMVLGTTVLAGTQLYRLYSERIGEYGLKTGIRAEGQDESKKTEAAGTEPGGAGKETAKEAMAFSAEENTAGETKDFTPVKNEGLDSVEAVEIQVGYLPEGMVKSPGEDKYYFQDTPYQGGLSLVDLIAKEDCELLENEITFVAESEERTISGHNAVLLVRKDRSLFDKILYIYYPEVQRVLAMYAGKDLSREEALKIAESIELAPTGEILDQNRAWTWNDYVKGQKQEASDQEESEEKSMEPERESMQAVEKASLKLHKIGEEILLPDQTAQNSEGEYIRTDDVSAKVTEVQIVNDLSLLGDSQYVEKAWLEAVDEEGKLLPNTIEYIKQGDGIDTLDEVVKTEEVAQKLVYATIEYTNNGDQALKNLLFSGLFVPVLEDKDSYTIYDRAKQQADADWDLAIGTGAAENMSMGFFDIRGGERGNNYIPSLEPGETVTVHIANILNEDELDTLFLNLSPYGVVTEFEEHALQIGYVGIH